MKVDREKKHKRILHYYLQNFRLTPPYRIIMDYDFLAHLKAKKLGNVKELFPKLFGAKAYPMVTECMVKAALKMGDNHKDNAKFMASFERAPCNHGNSPIAADDCLKEVLTEGRYCLAARKKSSFIMSHSIPHVLVLMWDPVNVLVLRAPPKTSKIAVEEELESRRFHVENIEKKITEQILIEEKRRRAEENRDKTAKIAYLMRFHHKPVAKGPHPLSVRKKMTPEEKMELKRLKMAQSNKEGEEMEEDDQSEESDNLLFSRSKLRRKRKRAEMKLQKIKLQKKEQKHVKQEEQKEEKEEDHLKSKEQQQDVEMETRSEELEPPKPKRHRPRRRPRNMDNQESQTKTENKEEMTT